MNTRNLQSEQEAFKMNRVKVNLKNCYGIKSLETEFDFSDSPAYAIYAPNGVMKSSLAATFNDAAEGRDSLDRIFQTRKNFRQLLDETGTEIGSGQLLVIRPYNELFGVTEKTSTLLIDPKLRKVYEDLVRATIEGKDVLLKAIGKLSGGKRDFQTEIALAFTRKDTSDSFDLALTRIQRELTEQKDAPYSDVKYDIVFNDKVTTALSSPELRDAIRDYVLRYNELLAKSTYFKKGTFDYYNAAQIAKSLADNGFFSAKHTVSLNADSGNQQITTQDELEGVISHEKAAILSDSVLRKKFDDVANKLNKNADLRAFCNYLQTKEELLSRMSNPEAFKEDVLKSYLKANMSLYMEWLTAFDAASVRRKKMEEDAAATTTQWEEVINIFNDRFTVPFNLSAKNKTQVMFGHETIIDLEFTYIDGTETAPIEKGPLIEALSNGEKKALYILYLIFEIQTRIKNATETLVIVDDIADSFDYQNKYAIIQYLKDISENSLFKLIIMTHNFDFFRTIESRFVKYSQCLMASKSDKGITLIQASGIKNIFAKELKGKFFSDKRMKIACIPFLRNLVEMTAGEADQHYVLFTSVLHWKPGVSDKLTIKEIDDAFNSICKENGTSANASKLVVELIDEEAKECLAPNSPAMNIEIKLVLAIGIRLTAERFMINKIADDAFLATIKGHQTQKLVREYKKRFELDVQNCKTLDKVELMTPENIHVNSFMYEPIIDMADDSLKKLYTDVLALK